MACEFKKFIKSFPFISELFKYTLSTRILYIDYIYSLISSFSSGRRERRTADDVIPYI